MASALDAVRANVQAKLLALRRKRDYIQLFVDQRVAYPVVPEDLCRMMAERGWTDEENTHALLRSVTDLQKTQEKIHALAQQIVEATQQADAWARTAWKSMWLQDLEQFIECVPAAWK